MKKIVLVILLFISFILCSCNSIGKKEPNKGYSILSPDYPNNFHKGQKNNFTLVIDPKIFAGQGVYISADFDAFLWKNGLQYSLFSKKDSAQLFFVTHSLHEYKSYIMETKTVYFK